MNLTVITAEGEVSHEVETLKKLLSKGLKKLHVRKPDWPVQKIEEMLKQVGKKHFKKIAVHGHPDLVRELGVGGIHLGADDPIPEMEKWKGTVSRSCHSIEEVKACSEERLDYCWLSPIFDSISKPNYKSGFEEEELRELLRRERRCEVYALGGVHPERMGLVQDMGFDGAALLGSIWQHGEVKERLAVFEDMKERCQDMKTKH